MFEYHDHPGDDHDHLAPPDTDAPGDPGADALAEPQLPPLGDLTSPADAAAELHFPGDEAVADVAMPDVDPAAPFPDDGDFTQWLGGPVDDAVDAPAEPLLMAPENSDALPSSDELVDWTLRRLGDDA